MQGGGGTMSAADRDETRRDLRSVCRRIFSGRTLPGRFLARPPASPTLKSPQPSRNEITMYIGSGILVTVLIVLAIIFFAKRV